MMLLKQSLRFALSVKQPTNSTNPGNAMKFDNKMVQLANLLATGLKLPYVIVSGSSGGILQPDGNWTGIIGMVHRGEADLAVAPLSITKERQNAVDFSYPFYVDSISFVTRRLKPHSEIFAIFHPFSLEVWIMLFIFTFAMTVVFYHVLKNFYCDIVLNVIAGALRQPLSFKYHSPKENFLIFIWIMGMMFITHSYVSVLLSALIVPSINLVKNIQELSSEVNRGTYQIMVRKSSAFPKSFLTSSDDAIRIIGRNINENPNASGSIEIFLNSTQSNLVYIEIMYRINFLKDEFFISNDNFYSIMTAVATGKEFCYKKKLDMVINKITASGLYKKLLREDDYKAAFYVFSENNFQKDLVKSLSLEDISGAFVILIIGLCFSSLTFISELLIKHNKVIVKRKRNYFSRQKIIKKGIKIKT